jgi:hypothetical protein
MRPDIGPDIDKDEAFTQMRGQKGTLLGIEELRGKQQTPQHSPCPDKRPGSLVVRLSPSAPYSYAFLSEFPQDPLALQLP